MSALLAPYPPAPPMLTEEDLAEIARARGKHWSNNRERALRRDKCCQIPSCATRWNLEVHHIKPLRCFSRRQEARANALSNLVVLCRDHHRLVEESVRHLPSAPDRLPDNLDWRVARTLSNLKHYKMRTGPYALKLKVITAQAVACLPKLNPPTIAPKAWRLVLKVLREWLGDLTLFYGFLLGIQMLALFLHRH